MFYLTVCNPIHSITKHYAISTLHNEVCSSLLLGYMQLLKRIILKKYFLNKGFLNNQF